MRNHSSDNASNIKCQKCGQEIDTETMDDFVFCPFCGYHNDILENSILNFPQDEN